MKTKICTSIDQSKKLLELGVDVNTADMWYQHIGYSITDGKEKSTYFPMVIRDNISDDDIPCWSLAALLDVLESEIDGEEGETYKLKIEKEGNWWNVWYEERYDEANPIETESTEYLVDACYKMILDLHELKLL